ncbi:MAG: hypothetical protein A2X49_13210 [Lentisphaerae bacterium GWF2_52_8]|nr:MAG: hypothetical protein A2X49_13210 [Lentisphaerae bacterium GWF2_52_8]
MHETREKQQKARVSEMPIFMPQCQALANLIISEIKKGSYLPGQKLKSVRMIAMQYGVGRQVALSAIQILARDNYVYTERGAGTFVRINLKHKMSNKIGLFINRLNPAYRGTLLHEVQVLASKAGYKFYLGSNFGESFSVSDWLAKNQMDGLIITGLVDRQSVRELAATGIPYVVMGNYDIGAEHPQANADMQEIACNALYPVLKGRRFQSVAAIVGTLKLKSDRDVARGIKAAIEKAGLTFYPHLIRATHEDGYADLAYLFEEATPTPDFVYFQGEHIKALVKYLENHPDFKRPSVCINAKSGEYEYIPRELWDISVNCIASTKKLATRAMKILLKQL